MDRPMRRMFLGVPGVGSGRRVQLATGKAGCATFTGTAQQGSSVSVSPDGNTAVVGGVGDNTNVGAAWVFKRANDGTWTTLQKLLGNDSVGLSRQGTSVALSADGNTIIVGAKDDTLLSRGADLYA